MDTNSQQTPLSEQADIANFKRSIWWKVYFYLITFITGIGMGMMLSMPNSGISEYTYLAIWLLSTVGFFGYVFTKPIGTPGFWLWVFVSNLLIASVYCFITDVDLRMGQTETEYYTSTAIGWILSVPAYIGLFLYSRADSQAWLKR